MSKSPNFKAFGISWGLKEAKRLKWTKNTYLQQAKHVYTIIETSVPSRGGYSGGGGGGDDDDDD